jgi:oligopeptidase B
MQKRKLEIITEPIAKRQKTIVKFGEVPDQDRGTNIMNPPLETEDYYHWLRDDNRTNKEVLNYLEQENKYTEAIMADTKDLQEELYREIRSRYKASEETHPYAIGDANSPYRYFQRTAENQNYPTYCRNNLLTHATEVTLDVNKLAEGHKHCDVVGVSPSNDHTMLAYAVDFVGDEMYEVFFKDLETGELLDYELPEKLLYGDFEWGQHDKYIYYLGADETNRISKFYRYCLETATRDLLFEENDPLFSISFKISSNGKYLLLSSKSTTTSEVWYLNLEKDDPRLWVVNPRTPNIKYYVDCHEDNFIISTNMHKALNYKLMHTHIPSAGSLNWEDIKSYNEKELICDMACFRKFIAVSLRVNGFKRIAIIKYEGGVYKPDWHYIHATEECAHLTFGANYVYDTNKLLYCYTSMVQPLVLYEYDMETGEQRLLRSKEIPNYDTSKYRSELLHAPSYYGVTVPISIMYKKDKVFRGTPAPLYLYGYGAYGYALDASFDNKINSMISLLDRGFIYAVAHVRGGTELGYNWYLDGRMHNKMNTFLDFIACCEYLIKWNFTKSSMLTIDGRSAGGLLMGACMTLRPDLFNTVIACVPFVDVLNTMSDPDIPLTTGEWLEWGNPNKKEDYVYMKQYCPYTNIKKVNYPNTLFLGGLHDPRVAYWEPAKFVAKLRFMKTDKKVHLLKTDMDQGHFSVSNREKYMRESAFILAFTKQCLQHSR